MVALTEFSWEAVSAPDFVSPARTAWRAAVAEIAEKAKAALPECNGRVESAAKLVLAGDVALQADGTARVASQSNGQTVYHIVNGHCDCKDYPKAPHNFCKHRLSAAIARRATELVTTKREQLDSPSDISQPPAEHSQAQPQHAPAAALPEAPASVNCHIMLEGRQVQVTLRDTDETRLLTRLAALLQQYPTVQPPTAPPALGTAQPPQEDSPYCHQHRVPLQPQQKQGQSWYSHKLADGSWCKGK